jgi:Protein of unknown function (DUF3445)
MRPDLRLLHEGLPICQWSTDSLQACEEKLDIYERWIANPRAAAQSICTQDQARPQLAMEYLLTKLLSEHSNWQLDLDQASRPIRWRVHVANQIRLDLECSDLREWRAVAGDARLCKIVNSVAPALRLWWACGFVVHEDLVLMRQYASHAEGQLAAECLHVSFPSGWLPAEKLGQSFASIHAPVADGRALQKASRAIGRALVERGPFERFVWTVSDTSQRARLPGPPVVIDRFPSDLWFRVERQVSLPLPDLSRSLFLIRVHLFPLKQVFENAAMKQQVLDSLASMSDAIVRYKGLESIRAYLVSKA